MSNNTLVAIAVATRSLTAAVALGGAAYLASTGKEGWGWLIFAAVLLGCYNVRAD